MVTTNSCNDPYQSTKGDLIVGTGSGNHPIILPVGTNGQVLTAASGQTSGVQWQTNASLPAGFVFLESQPASNVASVSFTTGITTAYNAYVITIQACNPQVDGSTLGMVISINGGATYLTTGYTSGINYALFSTPTYTNQNTNSKFLIAYQQSTNNPYLNAFIKIDGTGSGTFSQDNITGYCSYGFAGTDIVMANIAGYNTNPAATNAIQFSYDTGNIIGGIFNLYGLASS